MSAEELDKNHYKTIVIEYLKSRIDMVKKEGTFVTDKDIEEMIENFFEEFKESELAKFESTDEIKERLKKLEERTKNKKEQGYYER